MNSPHLNVSGLDFTPPASMLAAATTTVATTVSKTAAKTTASLLSRVPWWVWAGIAAIVAYFAVNHYRKWRQRQREKDEKSDTTQPILAEFRAFTATFPLRIRFS